MWINIVGVMIGGLITFGTAVFVEYLRSPKLRLYLCDPTDHEYPPDSPAQKTRFVHLAVENKELPCWARWMLRATATECHGVITFHHLDGQNILGRSMEIRWGGTPEPVPMQVAIGKDTVSILDMKAWGRMQRVDIGPGESQVLNVAARFDKDEECYGWNNEAYFSDPPWRNPKWRLAKGRYLVKVAVVSSGQKCSGTFRLSGDVPIDDFRIIEAQEGDVARG